VKPPPELSVIVPVHNEEKRLDSCLFHLLSFLGRQAYESEIILVENGSTDLTPAKVRWW
jgi:glycosyltransferase involved in cell wall biosynthesis